MFEAPSGSHLFCVATPVIYYSFWCVFSIPYGERYLKNGQIPVILDFDIEHPRLSSSSLASSTEAQRPSRFEFISCESLRTITGSILDTDYLQLYHKR